MSRYGRISDADQLDRYYSPQWPLDLLYEDTAGWLPWTDPQTGEKTTIAEPCAGQGAMVKWMEMKGHDVIAGDIDPGSPYPQADARTDIERYEAADMVVTNPPYAADTGTAFEILDAMLGLEVPIAMLLRLSFLEPPKRGDRKACYMDGAGVKKPKRIIVLPRVQYGGPKGGTDNPATSVWVIWRPGIQVGGCETRWRTWEDRVEVGGQESLL